MGSPREDAMVKLVRACLPAVAVTTRATLTAADAGGYSGEDRISALTDDLLCAVVSCLPIGDAVRTTALCSRWRHIWHGTPLVLHSFHVPASTEPERVAAVGRILAGHPGPFRTVDIACCFKGNQRELAEWPALLAARGVQDLAFLSLPSPIYLPLASDILRCGLLRRLYVGFLAFPDTSNLPEGAGFFPRLEELAIMRTEIEDRDLDHMLASSPVLKTLALVLTFGKPSHVRLLSRSLQCVLFKMSLAVELAVVDAPRLERLILLISPTSLTGIVLLRIAHAPELKVLGYLRTTDHRLQIGDNVIKSDTMESPSSVVPSVKILALKVNFSVSTEVQMLVSFLRCFPNIETLHLESVVAEELSGQHNAEFFEKLIPIECVQSHIKKVFLHEFRGHQSEITFLKYLSQRANQMQKLTLALSVEILDSVGDITGLPRDLVFPPWASESCTVSIVKHIAGFVRNFHSASDFSIHDPFISGGKEFFSFIKRRENIE